MVQIISRESNDTDFISDASGGNYFYYLNDDVSVAGKTPVIGLTVSSTSTNKKATSVLDLKISVNYFFIFLILKGN